jgi:hypothetical protein
MGQTDHYFLFSSNFCHHGSGGSAVDSLPSQQDPYLSPCEDFKLIACSVQEIWLFKVVLPNCDATAGAVRSTQQQQQQQQQ